MLSFQLVDVVGKLLIKLESLNLEWSYMSHVVIQRNIKIVIIISIFI